LDVLQDFVDFVVKARARNPQVWVAARACAAARRIPLGIGRSRSYDDLIRHTEKLDLGEELRVLVPNLETLIAVKKEVAGERDLAVLPMMRRTLEEKRHR